MSIPKKRGVYCLTRRGLCGKLDKLQGFAEVERQNDFRKFVLEAKKGALLWTSEGRLH